MYVRQKRNPDNTVKHHANADMIVCHNDKLFLTTIDTCIGIQLYNVNGLCKLLIVLTI